MPPFSMFYESAVTRIVLGRLNYVLVLLDTDTKTSVMTQL
jgi:hypothetical protein